MSLKKLIESRAKLIKDAQALSNEKEFGSDKDKQSQFNKMMDEAAEKQTQINAIKQADEAAANLEKPVEIRAGKDDLGIGEDVQEAQEDAYNSAFDVYLREGRSELSSEQKAVLKAGPRKFDPNAAQEIGNDAKGGHTVPEGFINRVAVALKYYNALRESGATILPTANGQVLPHPTFNGTAVKGRRIGEGAGANTQDMDFGVTNLAAHTYTSDIILVSNELLQDTGVDLVGLIADQAGERIGRITNEEFTITGTGTAPVGVVDASVDSAVVAASNDAVTFEELLDLKHSVDMAYRKNPTCGWMFSDATLAQIAKMKDGENRPLLLPSIRDAEPDRILGHRYTVNPDMADFGASEKSILFGAFDKYIIRDVSGGVLKRLDERYADDNQTAFLMFTRHDGALVDTGGAIKYLSMAA